MSEYIVIKGIREYQILSEEDIRRTEIVPHIIRIHSEDPSCLIEGELVGVFEKYSDAIRATIDAE